MGEQHFCLRWNNYRTNITAEFETLREGEHFVDVTLACDGQQLKAHKVVLSACSPYFKDLLQANPCTHPIIILRDVAYSHMRSLLEFMYAGEVNISQTHLAAFLHTAEALKIRGLAESSDDRKEIGGCNNVSPLSQLKSSLGGGASASGALGMTLGSLSSSMLERPPLMPQLLPHHSIGGDKPLPSHHLSPHMGPSTGPIPLASPNVIASSCGSTTTLPSVSPASQSTSAASTSSPLVCSTTISSNTKSNGNVNVGPLQLTVPSRTEVGADRGDSSPPLPPPSKRARCERKPTPASSPHDSLSDKNPTNNNNNSSSNNNNNNCSLNGTTSSTSSTLTSTSISDEVMDTVPKTEPCDSVASDNEGGAWPDDADNASWAGHVGPEGIGTPGPTPPGSTPPPSHHPENNASHLLSALNSESPLQGVSAADDPERPYPLEDSKHDHRQDLRSETRDVRLDLRGERSSPPLPPSSLPHSCQFCGKLISCRRNLWKHMERVHFTNPAVQCSLCAKMFKNKYALKDHQRIYHGGLSEPQHPPHPSPAGSASLLSRILHDPTRLSHPSGPVHHEPRSPIDMPQISSHSHRSSVDAHNSYPRRPPEDDEPVNSIASYSNMAMGSLLPPSLIGNSSLIGAPSRSEWTSPDESVALVSHAALMSEIHHMVTKAD